MWNLMVLCFIDTIVCYMQKNLHDSKVMNRHKNRNNSLYIFKVFFALTLLQSILGGLSYRQKNGEVFFLEKKQRSFGLFFFSLEKKSQSTIAERKAQSILGGLSYRQKKPERFFLRKKAEEFWFFPLTVSYSTGKRQGP